MNRSVLALMVLALATSAQAADQSVYRARSGDTLWDLSARFWKDAWSWPELWALNPHFHNPHWIAPGDAVYLAPRGATGSVRLPLEQLAPTAGQAAGPPATPEEKVAAAEASKGSDAAREREITFAKSQAQDFVSSHRIAPTGVVHNRKVPKQIYAAGEDVEIDLSKDAGVKSGDLLTLYEDSKRVVHPKNRSLQGYHVRVLGHVRIRSVSGSLAEGELVETYDTVGDSTSVMPYRAPITRMAPRPASAGLQGVVLDGVAEKTLFSEHDVVFLDRGTLHGVQPGSVLDVPLAPQSFRAEGASDLWRPAARLMVVSVEEKTSAGLVLESRTNLSAGDRFVASALP